MADIKSMLKLYAVTDRAWTGNQTLLEQTEAALRGGITCLQLREKKLDYESFLKEAIQIKDLCKSYSVPLIINDNPLIAVRSGADGVHIGQKDISLREAREITGKNLIIGVTAASPELAAEAEKNGADYIGSGAVFGSSTKDDARSLSRDVLKQICSCVSVPVVAIGGINRSNMPELSGTGISGVALVSGIFAAEDIENECRELLKASENIISGGNR